ncbi:MAG: hypothetical protein J6Y94_06440 [Bacteriovoracaceae bacterium]|nr:hypothetical protein [Bacteriovoracaceae bacterium]
MAESFNGPPMGKDAKSVPVLSWKQWPLDDFTRQVLEFILGRGLGLTLVGGGVRSLLTDPQQALDHILDFEIRHPTHLVGKEWLQTLAQLKTALGQKFAQVKIQEHLFQSWTLKHAAFTIDFTSPRLEDYTASTGRHGFSAAYASDLPYPQAWARRDFTINAMGFELRMVPPTSPGQRSSAIQVTWIDPFGGLHDWQQRELNIISDDFYHDPVRFLRFVRWRAIGFKQGPQGPQRKRMDLTSLSRTHLAQEALKSDFFVYLQEVDNLGRSLRYNLPRWMIWRMPLGRWQRAALQDKAKFRSLLHVGEWVMAHPFKWGDEFWQFWGLGKARRAKAQDKVKQLKVIIKLSYLSLQSFWAEGKTRYAQAPRMEDLAVLKKVKWPWEELAQTVLTWPAQILASDELQFWQNVALAKGPRQRPLRQAYFARWKTTLKRSAWPALQTYAWLITAALADSGGGAERP